MNVFVEDQDRAKAFYTEKLGFEVRNARRAISSPAAIGLEGGVRSIEAALVSA